jgi:hypothetical protein
MALCIAAYGFLISERILIPPSDNKTVLVEAPSLSYPSVINPADPPIRTERHLITSIASLRIKLARNIVRRLPR